MKFAHLGDCHLGSWRQPELKELNFKSFQLALETCIKEKVDFILIAGDLFDSAYPSIDTLKQAFDEFRKVKEAKIPVFLIAGSHDYSVSGKTFLDVLARAGFCTNVFNYEEKNGQVYLFPTIYKNVAIYGYPGKKSALEVDEIEKIKFHDSPGLFKILMLHTAIRDAVPNMSIKAVDDKKLPKVNYLALAHLHINYNKDGKVYSGPTFPNSLLELEELGAGSFYIFDNGKIKRQEIRLKEVLFLNLEIKDSLKATELILEEIKKSNLKDKIVIIKLYGVLEVGKISDIDFAKIERHVKESGAYVFVKSTSKLHMPQPEIKLDLLDTENLESQIIKRFEEGNPSKFNDYIYQFMRILQAEKSEDEKSAVFEERIISEFQKALKNEI
ncbi:exonuclease SbcCD subunit D [Candidatus Pacearchaeota archaeon]|nr:exonuclease SbcCD subunit D [Candidatus Pacearchaeota archaeon]